MLKAVAVCNGFFSLNTRPKGMTIWRQNESNYELRTKNFEFRI